MERKDPESDNPNWYYLRKSVWERDGGICQVCGLNLNVFAGVYECGHIVDRFCGGPDEVDNLVVMCAWCNNLKPYHENREAYEQWLKNGYWLDWAKDRICEFAEEDDIPIHIAREAFRSTIRYAQLINLGFTDDIRLLSAETVGTKEFQIWLTTRKTGQRINPLPVPSGWLE